MDATAVAPRDADTASSRAFSYHAVRDGDDTVFHGVPPTGSTSTPPPATLYRSVSEQLRPPIKAHEADVGRKSLPDVDTIQSHTNRPHIFRTASPIHERNTFTMGQFPPFVRELSLLIRRHSSVIETVRCHICFDDIAVGESVALSACGHRFCRPCLKSYLELKITEGSVYPVCFHPMDTDDGSRQRACGASVTTEQIEELVSPESSDKLKRFRFSKENELARECPFCSHAQLCRGPQTPVCTCQKCSRTFCFLHGNAHPDGSCADYELRHAETEAINRAKIQEISKPCPGCRRDVEKNGGCNHMKCIACHTHFCWLCGEIVEDAMTPAHYDASNGGACSGRQFDGMETPPPEWWMQAYIVLAIAICAPPAAVLALGVAPFVWCFFKSTDKFGDVFERVVAMLTIVLQMPLAIVYFTVVFGAIQIARLVRSLYRAVKRMLCSASQRRENEPRAAVARARANDLEAGNAVVRPVRNVVDI